MLNKLIMIGRLTADPELRHTKSDVAVCSFRIAVPRRFAKDDTTDFFDVESWRGAAEFVSKHFEKGKLIFVEGCLQSRSWVDKDNNKRQSYVIVAEQVSFVGTKPKEDSAQSTSHSTVGTPAFSEGFDPFAAATDEGDLPF